MKLSFAHKQFKNFEVMLDRTVEEMNMQKILESDIYTHPGQQAFLDSKEFNVLAAGTKGSGKSYALARDFMQDVGKGFGSNYRGFLVRITLKELNSLTSEIREIIKKYQPKLKYKYGDRVFRFESGEILELMSARTKSDSYKFKGQNACWIGFDELTSWRTPDVFHMAATDIRSKVAGINVRLRSSTNSEGPGKQWVKRQFYSPAPIGVAHGPEGAQTKYLEFYTKDNKALLDGDPFYMPRIKAMMPDQSIAKAFTEIDWSDTSGLFFMDVWKENCHVVKPFKIPSSWVKTRSCDWGTSAPFSVSWGAKSDGTDYVDANGKSVPTNKGDIYIFANLYGNYMVYERNPLGVRIEQLYEGD